MLHTGRHSESQIYGLLNLTGSRIGAVNARQQIPTLFPFFDFFGIKNASDVQYAPVGPNSIIFHTKEDFVNTNTFKKLKGYSDHQNPFFAILGGATASLIAGLLQDIPQRKWEELNNNPDTRMLFQQSLFRLQNHLINAENHQDDFVLFSQSLELAHCEIAALLMLCLSV